MLALFAPRFLPSVSSGFTTNFPQKVANMVRGKWAGKVLRYEPAGQRTEKFFKRADESPSAKRDRQDAIKLTIRVIHRDPPLGMATVNAGEKPMRPADASANSGIGNAYGKAAAAPLHQLIAALDCKLVPRNTRINNAAASVALSKPGDSAGAVSSHQGVNSAPLEKSGSGRQKFFEGTGAKRRELPQKFPVKFSRMMEKSGTELHIAARSCDAAFQEIYTRAFDFFLDKEKYAVGKLENTLHVAHAYAEKKAVEQMGASGNMDDRNYAKFLSTFRSKYTGKPPIPPRTGIVAYRAGAVSPPQQQAQPAQQVKQVNQAKQADAPVYATALAKSQRPASKSPQFSHPKVFMKMFGDALKSLIASEAADLDAHLNEEERDLSELKRYCRKDYSELILQLFKDNLAKRPVNPTVSMQYGAYTTAEAKALKDLEKNSSDMGKFSKFMSQFTLEIVDATEFRFVRYEDKPLVFQVPDVLRRKEPVIRNKVGAPS